MSTTDDIYYHGYIKDVEDKTCASYIFHNQDTTCKQITDSF